MPHFRYLDRYWNFAGDELSVPSLCSITARLLWTCLIAVVYGISYQHLQQCDDNWLLQTYLLVSILLFIATIFCDGLIIQVSLKGTIIAQGERSQLSKHLNLKIALTFLQVLCGIFGILSLSLGSDLPCNQDVESSMVSKVFVAIVASSQLLDMVVLFCCCYCLQARGKDHEEMLDESLVLATWESRCRTVSKFFQYFLCNLFGGGNVEEGFEQVAKVFTAFFHHNGFLDVVPSDVVAGIVLVRVEQRKRRKNRNLISSTYLPIQRGTTNSLKSMNISSNSNEAFDLAITEDQNASRGVVSNLDEIDCWLRCSTFSLAMYTHIMVLYMNPCTGPCKLCCHDCMNGFCSCGTVPLTSISKSELLVEGDNCCRLNNTGMKIFTNYLQNSELLYVSYKNDTTHKPFGVFLDHDKEWLVIAVRGTLSLEDCITDVTCEPVEVSLVSFFLVTFTNCYM